jgi:NADPH-dependent 2,4-dienoyl-CoA reductase/sulfur reductase-like enzyme
MIPRADYDVIVLGGGPAGLAAAIGASAKGARVGLIEREERLGGILKQCVHDGFGLKRFGEGLTGPEYARRYIDLCAATSTKVHLETFVHRVRREGGKGSGRRFVLECVSGAEGVREIAAPALVLATGCRERTDRQVFIHGDRPAGILTAGLAQRLVNIEGLLPGKKAVMLGSGDIGLIMARRLALEGMAVEGVYEIKAEPSGLARNLQQCLDDFGIPLHLRSTVTAVHGKKRVEAVTVAEVDERGRPRSGTERIVPCDTLVLSVGLIPEDEIAASLGLTLDPATRGPRVDQFGASAVDGVYVCGNALHVNDLVDYVSESGATTGAAAAAFALETTAIETIGPGSGRRAIRIKAGAGFLYAVPQFLDISRPGRAIVYFRSNATIRDGARVRIKAEGAAIFDKLYTALRPPEMERVELDIAAIPARSESLLLELERREAVHE